MTTTYRVALPKNSHLFEEVMYFLKKQKIDLDFSVPKEKLSIMSSNLKFEFFLLRNNDIPAFVKKKFVDAGITSQDALAESKIQSLFKKPLGLGKCELVIAIPVTSQIASIRDLRHKLIATSHPNLTAHYFKKKKIPINIVKMSGSLEVAPKLNIADAIVGIKETGATLRENEMKILKRIKTVQAILISRNQEILKLL